MRVPRTALTLTAAVILAGTLGAIAQDLPAPPPNEAPEAQIVHVSMEADGADVFVAGPPGKLYALMIFEPGAGYQFAGMLAEVEPGIYTRFDAEALNHSSRIYTVVTREQQWPNTGPEAVQNLVAATPGVQDLLPHQLAALQNAAQRLVAVSNALNDLRRQLIECEKRETDCLKLVAAARAAMLAAEDAAKKAGQALKDATSRLEGLQDHLGTLNDDLATAEARRDQWFHELNVFLDWAADFEAAGNDFHAAQMRENAANAQEKYEAWDEAVRDLKQDIADTETDIANATAAKEAAEADKAAKEQAAKDAKDAYEKAKRDCKPCEDYAQNMRDNVQRARDAKDQAAQEFRDAQDAAAGQAQENRDNANNQPDPNPDPDPPAPSGPPPSQVQDMHDIAKFLLWIKQHAGEDEYEDLLRSMFGAALEAGTVTMDVLKSFVQSAATGGAYLTPQAFGGAALSIFQALYGVLVSWAQSAATNATVKLASRTIAALAVLHVPKKGDIKFVPNHKTGTAELYIRNHDGSVTVYTYRRSTGLRVCTFKGIP